MITVEQEAAGNLRAAEPEQNVAENLRSVAKHSAIYTTAEILKRGIGFIMIPLYTHYLAPADYGLIEILNLIVEIMGIIVGVRILSAETRFYHIYEPYEDKREVYTTALLFSMMLSVVTVSGLWFAAPAIAQLTLGSEAYAPHCRLMILCFGIQNVFLVAENDLIVRKKSLFYALLCIGLLILSLSLNIVLLSVFHLGAWAILWSIFITKVANLAVVPATLRGDRLRFSAEKFIKMLKYGLPLVPASLAMFALHYNDRFFVQRYCSLTDLGIYSLGYKFGMIIAMLVTAPFNRAWGTHAFEISNRPEAPTVYARMLTYLSCLLALIALCISVFIDDFIGILAPPSYGKAAALVPLIALAYVLVGLHGYVGLGIMLTFRTHFVAYIHIPSALLNVGLNIVLIRQYGIWGAAISTLVTFALMLAVTFWVAQRLHPIPYEYKRLGVLTAVSFALFAAARLASGSSILVPLYHAGVVLAFPALLLLLKFFTKEELSAARRGLVRVAPWLVRTAA